MVKRTAKQKKASIRNLEKAQAARRKKSPTKTATSRTTKHERQLRISKRLEKLGDEYDRLEAQANPRFGHGARYHATQRMRAIVRESRKLERELGRLGGHPFTTKIVDITTGKEVKFFK